MVDGKSCGCGQGRKEREKRKNGLDAFASRHDIRNFAEPDGMAIEMAHGAARFIEWRFIRAVACKISALETG